jgi:hypothetical protein
MDTVAFTFSYTYKNLFEMRTNVKKRFCFWTMLLFIISAHAMAQDTLKLLKIYGDSLAYTEQKANEVHGAVKGIRGVEDLGFIKNIAQDTSPVKISAPSRIPPVQNNRVRLVTIGNIAAYGATSIALYAAWYKNYPQSSFHFFNDNKEWLQVDKAGHAWSAYTEGRLGIGVWRWAGLPDKKAIWVGGLSGLGYQTIIEIMDGFSSEWGFSWGDYLANMTGSTLLIGQELVWKEQKILLKFSSHRRNYGDDILNDRANSIYGIHLPERILKDYNAQTYWFSMNIKSFLKQTNIPCWLNIAFGYGADDMFGANNNVWKDKNGVIHDRSNIKRYRQFYIAPDIDLTKIKIKNKFVRTALFILNSLKFPTPSLEFSNGNIRWNWFHF